MLVDYNTLSESAKVWVYPSSRKFYPEEMEEIPNLLEDFVKNWKKEDEAFMASYQLLYNRFIVFLVEENTTLTHKYIDEKVAFIIRLQEKYNVVLLDKMNVCFKQAEYVQYKDLKEFQKLIKNKSVNDKTIVFDNLVQNKYELENYWETPITESWYNRFLK